MAVETNIGRVAFTDKGAYSSATVYSKWDFVTTTDSTYLYIATTPQSGKPVTDTAYWKCIANGKQATTAAQSANTAAATANTAAGLADDARLAIQDDLGLKADHGYVSNPKTLKEVDDQVQELELLNPEKYAASWVVTDLSPGSDKQYGDPSVADCWRPYLVDCTKNVVNDINVVGELKRNNFLRFTDNTFAPVVGITETMRAECDVELYLDAAHTQKYCDAGQFNAANFYNEYGISQKLYNLSGTEVRILRPWETTSQNYTVVIGLIADRWFIDNEIGNSGKKWKGVFARPTMWDGIEAKKLPRTGLSPNAPTTVGNKFRNFFFLYNPGDINTKSSRGTSNIVSMFYRTDRCYPRTTDVSQLSSVTYARANNADITIPIPFAEGGMFAYCAFLSSMETKHKTKNLHSASLFGSGISSNDACSNETQYRSNGGMKYSLDSGVTWVYNKWSEQNALYYTNTGVRTHMSNFFNSEDVKEQCNESQIAASYAKETGIGENTEFTMYGEKYFYKNVPGVNGLADGEMNVLVYKLINEDISAFDSAGSPLPAKIECALRMSLCNGFSLSGDVFKYVGGGCESVGLCTDVVQGSVGLPYKVYLEPDQTKFHKETVISKPNAGVFDFEALYPYMGEFITFNNYRKSLAPYTIAGGESGGSIATGECAYLNGGNYWSSVLNTRVRLGLRAGGNAHFTYCSPRIAYCYAAASAVNRIYAGFAQVLLRSNGAT